jgi:SPP1 gp7 family putative phage head morphogenesis protein
MSGTYWQDRVAAAQDNLTNKAIHETEKQLTKHYAKTMENVIADFEKTYNKLFLDVKEGIKPTPADLYNLDRYWQMQNKLKEELTKLGNKQAAVMSKNFTEQYMSIYNYFAIHSDLAFSSISTEAAQKVIEQIWCADGKSWSERIWKNIDHLQQTLNDGLVECVVGGKSGDVLKNRLMERFNVSFSNATSIVETELSHIQTQAARQRYLDNGITKVQFWAEKDKKRCKVCAELHKKIYLVTDTMPVPVHPRCRCCILPVIE